MSPDVEGRINDVIKCCEKIIRGTAGMSQTELADRELVMDGVIYNIAIIGEATKHIPDEVRKQMPNIEWKQIAGMRDWLIHAYRRTNPAIVWTVVETKIPELLQALQAFQDDNQP